jgi:hypothetical protein
VGLPDGERFVSLIHLGEPVQERAAPARPPASTTVTYLD